LVNDPGLAQLVIQGETNPDEMLWIGFDTSNDRGVIQAGIQPLASVPLCLNPEGGPVGIALTNPVGGLHIREAQNTDSNVVFARVGNVTALQAVDDATAALVPMQYHASAHYFTGGPVGLGMTNPAHQLELASDSAAKPNTNTWTVTSDIRTKQKIEPLTGGLAVIQQLEPMVAEYNGKAKTPAGTRVVSLDPEKLRAILPHAVSSVHVKLDPADATETDVLGVNTHEILYHLILAVQQLAKT